jgi:hypothetical protein
MRLRELMLTLHGDIEGNIRRLDVDLMLVPSSGRLSYWEERWRRAEWQKHDTLD